MPSRSSSSAISRSSAARVGFPASSVTVIRNALDAHAYGDIIKVKVYRCEGLKDAQSATDVGEGEYIDFDVTLFEFNTKA